MTTHAISRFPVPDLAALPADLQTLFHDVSEKAGFVPNVFWVLAHRPDELRAFWAYHEALMRRESGLSKGEREMIVVATSAENNCLYCVVAHGAILRIYEKSATILMPSRPTTKKPILLIGKRRCWISPSKPATGRKISAKMILPFFTSMALAMMISGTLARLPACLRCRTGWQA